MALADDINNLPTTVGDGNTGHLNNHQVIHAGLKSHETRLGTFATTVTAVDGRVTNTNTNLAALTGRVQVVEGNFSGLTRIDGDVSSILALPDGGYSETVNDRATIERGFPPGPNMAGWLQLRTSHNGSMKWAVYRSYLRPWETWENRSYNGTWAGWSNGVFDTGLRNINALVSPTYSTGGSGSARLQRTNNFVSLDVHVLRNDVAEIPPYTTFMTLPVGFRPSTVYRQLSSSPSGLVLEVKSNGDVATFNTPIPKDTALSTPIRHITRDATPTTFPGSPA